jgi:sensor domain CHASE-containing protein
MINMILLFAALLFAFGFLLGTVAHNHALHREYQRIAKRVRELRELQIRRAQCPASVGASTAFDAH